MADIAHRQTDKILAQMERKVKKEYRQATKEVEAKLQKYLEGFERRDAQKQQQVQNGTMTEQEYKQWRVGQIAMGDRWKEMRDNLADDYTNANKIAMSIVNGYMPDVYALNHNYGTYEAEKGAMVDTSYTLYDRQTVERLLRDNPDLLPKAKVDVPADKRWNKNKINSAITQGILQGDSLKDMAKRLESVSGMNRRAAFRNAATMTTSAQNGGRMDSYKRAEKMGIKMKKQWMATLDGHTRDSHRHIDGAIVDNDKPFELDGGELMFPGDAHGPAEEVYNCRCTMVAVVDGVDSSIDPQAFPRNSKLGDMSYDEWKNEHEKPKHEENRPVITKDFTSPIGKDLQDIYITDSEWEEPKYYEKPMTEKQIIDELGGGDETAGSCASVALAFAGCQGGLNIHDFKGGESQDAFSSAMVLYDISKIDGIKSVRADTTNDFAAVHKAIKGAEPEKYYILSVASHVAVVKKGKDGSSKYLELQSETHNGWKTLNDDELKARFGCQKSNSHRGYRMNSDMILFDVDSMAQNDEFKRILGFINTKPGKQQKGAEGYAR